MKTKYVLVLLCLFTQISCSKLSSSNPTADAVPGIPVPALQDKNLSFNVGSTVPGTYSISNMSAWASFDTATGILTGIPKTYADTFYFTITQHQATGDDKSYGPYQIQIIGNPLKEYQWHLSNTGQSAFSQVGGKAGEDIHLSNAVAAGLTGNGVKIAISDTGIVIAHEALRSNILAGQSRNYLGTSPWIGDPTPDQTVPDDAHGTAVSSLAAETGWNSVGGRGVAPGASLVGFLFIQAQDQLTAQGNSTAALTDQFNGAFDIFNYSWGDPQCTLTQYSGKPSLLAQLQTGTSSQRSGKGSVYVMAAGNAYADTIANCDSTQPNNNTNYFGNSNFSEIQTTPYIMNVAAVNALGQSSSYSTPGANIWISAPGGEYGLDQTQPGYPQATMPALVAADFPGCNNGLKSFDASASAFDAGGGLNGSCNYTSTMNGTSGATPIVSGAVALLLEANPALTWRDVRYILAKTADKVDPSVSPTNPSGSGPTGYVYEQGWITNAAGFNFMNYFGFGRVNVDNAVALARTYTANVWGVLQTSNWADTSGTIATGTVPANSSVGYPNTLTTTSTLTIESVQLKISTTNCLGSLGIELTGPNSVGGVKTKSIIMNINSGIVDTSMTDQIFLTNAFYGEHATGDWTIKVIDGSTCAGAKLTKWSLNFLGH